MDRSRGGGGGNAYLSAARATDDRGGSSGRPRSGELPPGPARAAERRAGPRPPSSGSLPRTPEEGMLRGGQQQDAFGGQQDAKGREGRPGSRGSMAGGDPGFVRRSFSRGSMGGAAGYGAAAASAAQTAAQSARGDADGFSRSFAQNMSNVSGDDFEAPSAMEIIEYAKYLGMNPIYDADLLWVAAEGLTAPLPAGWAEHEDETGNLYFYNDETDESTREHPLDKHYRQTYLNEKRKKEQQHAAAQGKPSSAEGSSRSGAGGGKQGLGFSFRKKKGGGSRATTPENASSSSHPLDAASAPKSAPIRPAEALSAPGGTEQLVLVPADIRDMAVYLGIHIRTEADMLWVARESLTATLPARWEELEDADGHPYYYNLVTGATTRKHPLDHYFIQLVKFERYNPDRFRQPGSSWMDFVDSQARVYFYNFEDDKTSYSKPGRVMDDDTIRWFSVGKKAQLEAHLATKIQAVARGRQARKRRLALKRLDEIRGIMAARRLGYVWRINVAARRVQRWHASMCRNVAWRIWRKNSLLSLRYQLVVSHSFASRTIQRYWRGYVARKSVGHVKSQLLEHRAATKIQARWRGIQSRRRIKKTKTAIKTRQIQEEARLRRLREERIARYLSELRKRQHRLWEQQAWRQWIVALEPRVEFQAKVKKIRAAKVIQNAWRMRGMKKKAGKHAKEIRKFQLVVHIQGVFRGVLARRRYKESRAAAQIQAVYRGRASRRTFVKHLAALRIQCVFRGYSDRTGYKKFMAARRIQCVWRGHADRENFKQEYAARKCQALWRGHQARKAFKMHYAAQKVQAAWRGYSTRKRGLLMQHVKIKAAVQIQAVFRGHFCRCKLKLARENAAASEIQRAFKKRRDAKRARKARKEMIELQARQEVASIKIQSAYRGKVVREQTKAFKAAQRERRQYLAATTIQARHRGRTGRKRVRKIRAERNAIAEDGAALKIQANYRGATGRRKARNKKETAAALVIQNKARQKAAKKAVAQRRREREIETRAVVMLQCFWRRVRAKRELGRRRTMGEMEEQRMAAVRLQKQWRGKQARRWLRHRKRVKKKDSRSKSRTITEAWMDQGDKRTNDFEEQEEQWPYERTEQWRGDIQSAFQAGKDLRNQRYEMLQDQLQAERSLKLARKEAKGGRKAPRKKKAAGANSTMNSTAKSSMNSSSRPPKPRQTKKELSTQKVYNSTQTVLRTLVQRGVFEDALSVGKSRTGGAGGRSVGVKKVSVRPEGQRRGTASQSKSATGPIPNLNLTAGKGGAKNGFLPDVHSKPQTSMGATS